jgi:high-affinity Fe2+/Pb2+ permease
VIPETSIVGEFMKALFGYNANPALMETIGYLGYFAAIFGLIRWLARKPVTKVAAAV